LGGVCFETSPGKSFKRSHLQNNQSKMHWRCGSRSRAPALQAQSLEFKTLVPLKKKRKKRTSPLASAGGSLPLPQFPVCKTGSAHISPLIPRKGGCPAPNNSVPASIQLSRTFAQVSFRAHRHLYPRLRFSEQFQVSQAMSMGFALWSSPYPWPRDTTCPSCPLSPQQFCSQR
jgi:hypothetical protein